MHFSNVLMEMIPFKIYYKIYWESCLLLSGAETASMILNKSYSRSLSGVETNGTEISLWFFTFA